VPKAISRTRAIAEPKMKLNTLFMLSSSLKGTGACPLTAPYVICDIDHERLVPENVTSHTVGRP